MIHVRLRYLALCFSTVIVSITAAAAGGDYQTTREAENAAKTGADEAAVLLTRAQTGIFKDALAALSKQAGVTFVVEGVPLRPALLDKDLPDLPASLSLSSAVEKLADAYDYEAKRRANVFVLKKRYSDPNDLPGVTPEECAAALEDVEKTLAPYNPGAPRSSSLVVGVMALLTPQQTQAMRGAGGLPIASLSAAQKAQVRRFALQLYVQDPLGELKNVLYKLKRSSSVRLRFGDIGRHHLFGYEVKRSSGEFLFFPFEAEIPDNPAPSEDEMPSPFTAQKADGVAVSATLGSVVSDMNRRGPKRVAAVDSSLAAKPVTVAGDALASPDQLLQALADVYGLRVVSREDGTRQITRRSRRAAARLSDLSANMRRVVPEPLLRAIQDGPPEAMPQVPDPKQITSLEQEQHVILQYEVALQRWRSQQSNPYLRITPLRQAALRVLSAAAENRLRGAPEKRLPLSEMEPLEQTAFAVVLMAKFLTILKTDIPYQAPAYIARFDELVLMGRPYKDAQGKQKLSFNLALSPGEGQAPRGIAGIFDVDYSQP